MICDECEASEAFPKDIVELESTLGIPRDLLTADMEKGKRCIVCGSILEEKVQAGPIKKNAELPSPGRARRPGRRRTSALEYSLHPVTNSSAPETRKDT